MSKHTRNHLSSLALLTALAFSAPPAATAQSGVQDGQWLHYGGDSGSTKYSALDQINEDNFDQLEIAWEWTSVDGFLSMTLPDGSEWFAQDKLIFKALQELNPNRWRQGRNPRNSGLKATPLMVNGVIYLATPLYQGAAIDAKTGETLWVYNPKSYETGTPTMSLQWNQRGVCYWTDGEGDERIYWGTGDAFLICVDAKTGKPVEGFGAEGRVDLTKGIPRASREDRDYLNAMMYSMSSPPLVLGDVIVTGSLVADRRVTKEAPPGDVRGWDVRTGALKWTFHTVPREGEPGIETWEEESWKYSGNANVWSMMSGDPELGYVYLPIGTATNDFYGGHRPGANLYAESLVCLNAETGEKIWHFQAVHHGMWDYDFPAAPNLVDIVVDGKPIKAVAQVSKQGFTYVFDRVTGEPVWPIPELDVPTSPHLPGETPYPTQPHPTKPPAFDEQGFTLDDLIDFTPELRAEALEMIENFTIGPLFTPPTLPSETGKAGGTLHRPGLGGGANWPGAGIDPETGILYIPSRNGFSVQNYYTPTEAQGGTVDYTHGGRSAARPSLPSRIPFYKPPYSRMTAIDLNTGEHAWMQPLGDGYKNHELLKDLDIPPTGGDRYSGPLVTKTLLIHGQSSSGIGGMPRESFLAARDKRTGELIGKVILPRALIGTPMTYMLDGKQYIAAPIGGGPPKMIALALPE